jgi:hypothetical protein
VEPRSLAADAPGAPASLGEAARVFLRHPSPRFLAGALIASLAVRTAIADFSRWDAVLALGIAAGWPLLEWTIHVFVLHAKPIAGFALDWDVPRKHRAHHCDPWEESLIFIPLQGFLVAVPLLVLLAVGLAPTAPLAATAVTVTLLFALHYEWVHFLVHTRYRPRTRLYARLWRNHRLHHFRNEHYWYGVTMLGGDRLLRTSPAPDAVATSPTCMALDAPNLRS